MSCTTTDRRYKNIYGAIALALLAGACVGCFFLGRVSAPQTTPAAATLSGEAGRDMIEIHKLRRQRLDLKKSQNALEQAFCDRYGPGPYAMITLSGDGSYIPPASPAVKGK